MTYHKACGLLLALFSSVHTIVHLINLELNIVRAADTNPGNLTYTQWLLTTAPGQLGTLPGLAYPTGIMMVTVLGEDSDGFDVLLIFIFLAIMLVEAVPAIRRHGYFEVFYWSHLTYLLFCLLHCLHSPVGLAWLLPPGLLFLLYKV